MEYKEYALTYEIYTNLKEKVGWLNFNENQTKEGLEKSLYSMVVFDGDIPVGMGRIVGDGLYDTICDVVIDPAYQGRGLGKELIRRLSLYAENSTPIGGRMCIQLIAAKGKEGFYKKQGFASLPNEESGPGMRKVILK